MDAPARAETAEYAVTVWPVQPEVNGDAAFAPTVADNFAHTVVRAMNARCKKGRR